MDRRRFLVLGGNLVLLRSSLAAQALQRNPFTLGVASGCPRERSVVLWTRLAPQPLAADGGMPPDAVSLRWRLCADASMRRSVREGVVRVDGSTAHAAHVSVQGLSPGREYWYQFHCGEDDSPVGRTRTTDAGDRELRFAVANCQNVETGFYAAWGDIAAWAPDCVLHLGDYIYEYGSSPLGERNGRRFVRSHVGDTCTTLEAYRIRHAQYRSDPQLQAAHAAAPFIAAFDDHEVANNWAGDTAEDPQDEPPEVFRRRKAAALQAWYEHLPHDRAPRRVGGRFEMPAYDRYDWGPVRLHVLDTRQYRDDQPCGDGVVDPSGCAEWQAPQRSMTGVVQERWLARGLASGSAACHLIAQQTWFGPVRLRGRGEGAARRNMDDWDGYPVQRERLSRLLRRVPRPVILSGDLHAAGAQRLRESPGDAASEVVGYEFAATSISSPCGLAAALDASRADNPDLLHADGRQRGYLRLTVGRDDVLADFRTVDDPWDARSSVRSALQIHTRDRP